MISLAYDESKRKEDKDMVRFKVIKGSHLLLAFAILLLAAAIIFIALQGNPQVKLQPTSGAQFAMQEKEAKAVSAFASDALIPLEIEILPDVPVSVQTNGKKILIYHTHTHEAYAQDSRNPYEAVETWRTEDEEHSVVRLGALLAEELRRCGYEVIHDTTDHEQDSINNSYVRSLHTLEGYAEEFDLCIDLHRDAYTDGLKDCVKGANDAEYAQLMLLVGRGDLYDTPQKPDYASNLAFAQQLTAELNRGIPDLCRNVTVKQGRYNQHIGKHSILVEVGHNQNTLAQAMASIPHLSAAIDRCMQNQ